VLPGYLFPLKKGKIMSKPTPYKFFFAFVMFTCGLAFSFAPAWAQSQASTGQLTGLVRDSNGAAIPNATIKARNTQTGLERTATSSVEGVYRIVLLPPGSYELTTEASGFARATLTGITVTIGQTIDVDVTLGVSAVTETVTITADAIQTTASNTDALLNENAINNLPINGRRFQDFVVLTPTAQIDPQRGQISLSGQRGINSNINIDGVDYNQPFFGGIRGGERSNTAFTVPQESIKEFQVVAAGYSAEFGRSSGGIVTAVTKSGSNSLHGSGFYLNRHRELAKQNAFKQDAAPTQNQFGGSLGGPFVKDKWFYFGSYEQQKLTNPRAVLFDRLVNFTPNAGSQEAATFLRALQVPFDQTNDAKAFLIKSDFKLNSNHDFNVRYSQSDNNALNANATGNQLFPTTVSALSNNGTEQDRTKTVVGQFNSTLASNLINEIRAQYSREDRPRLANAQSPTVQSAIGNFGAVRFLPTTQFDWRAQVFDNVTWILGNHTVKFGGEINHVFIDQTFAFNQFGVFNLAGSDTQTLLDIMSYSPGFTPPTGQTTTLNRFDNSAVTYLRQIGNGRLDFETDEFSLYGRDEWRVRSGLTVNYGVRWEGQYTPQPEANNDTLMNLVRGFRFPSGHVLNPARIPNLANQIAPRVGFSWDPFNSSKTVIRGWGGLYYARTPGLLFAGPLNNFRNPPGDLSVQLPLSTSSLPTTNPNKTCTTVYCQLKLIGVDLNTTTLDKLPVLTIAQVQSVAQALGLANFNPFTGAAPITWAQDYKNPKSYQWGGAVQRDLGRGFSTGVEYSQVNTMYLQRNRDVNLPVPVLRSTTLDPAQRPYFGVRVVSGNPTQPRPIPSLGSIQVRESTGRSVYQAMTARLELRRQKAQFGMFYTLSRSLSDDDNERDAGGVSFENAYDLRSEFNYSRLDRRHQFVGSAVFFLPGGFEASSTFQLRSALPIDVGTGTDSNADIGGPDRPYSAAGVPFKRNAFRNLSFYNVDLRLQKTFSFKERARLIFSTEFFNLFNFKNIQLAGSAVTNYCSGTIPANCGFSAPTNVNFLKLRDASGNYLTSNNPGAPFQLQFGARFQF
jgi:hypothetical protein